MDVRTIQIGRDEALQKLTAHRGLNARLKTLEDQRLESLYAAVSNGARVVNVREALKAAGVDAVTKRPKLAIARADWKVVYFHPRCFIRFTDERRFVYDHWERGAGSFSDADQFRSTAYSKTISFEKTFPDELAGDSVKTVVPHIPPDLRPDRALSNYHILFEVENWETYSVDPFLLKRIAGDLFVVLGEWELTELEASLLGSMRSGN